MRDQVRKHKNIYGTYIGFCSFLSENIGGFTRISADSAHKRHDPCSAEMHACHLNKASKGEQQQWGWPMYGSCHIL